MRLFHPLLLAGFDRRTPTPFLGPSEMVEAGSLKVHMDMVARDLMMDALKATGGNISEAARQLGITPRMARYKIGKLGIDYQRFFKKPRG